MKKQIIICGIILSLLQSGISVAYASQGNFTVYPSYKHQDNERWLILDAEAGKTAKDYITVENLSGEPQTIKLEAMDAVENDSSYLVTDKTNSWLNFGQNELTLAPREKIIVPVEMKIPEETTAGNYTGAILAYQKNQSDSNFSIVTRIGVRVYLNVLEPGTLRTDLLSAVNPDDIYFILSIFALCGSIGYALITCKDAKKYEKTHA